MPPKPPASTFAPAALGAALLGLSAGLLALDVGGTVVLDAPSGAPDTASASPLAAPAQPSRLAELPPAAAAQPAPAPVPVTLARHVYEPLAAARPIAVAPRAERRAPIERRKSILEHAVRGSLIALAERAPAARAVAVPVRRTAAVTRIASLSDVRHFAMRRLSKNYPNISVISADTYSIGGSYVRVSMVVLNGTQRWVEKDTVKRSGTSLALAKSARHGMPYAIASTSEPSTVAEPDPGP